MESRWKDVHKEHPDEFPAWNGGCFDLIVVCIVLVRESNGFICYGKDATIGDCGTERIACKVLNCISISVESLLDEREPSLLKQLLNVILPDRSIFEIRSQRKIKRTCFIKCF